MRLITIMGGGTRNQGDVILWGSNKYETIDAGGLRIKPFRNLAVESSGRYAAWITSDPFEPNSETLSIWRVGSAPQQVLKTRSEYPTNFESLLWLDDRLLISTMSAILLEWRPGESRLVEVTDTDPVNPLLAGVFDFDDLSSSTAALVSRIPKSVDFAVSSFLQHYLHENGVRMNEGEFQRAKLELLSELSFVAIQVGRTGLLPEVTVDVKAVDDRSILVATDAESVRVYDVSADRVIEKHATFSVPNGLRAMQVRLTLDGDKVVAGLIDYPPDQESAFEEERNLPFGDEPTQVPSLWVHSLGGGRWERIAQRIGPFHVIEGN